MQNESKVGLDRIGLNLIHFIWIDVKRQSINSFIHLFIHIFRSINYTNNTSFIHPINNSIVENWTCESLLALKIDDLSDGKRCNVYKERSNADFIHI